MAKYDQLYMDIAWRIAEQSHAVRLQVGCVIEKQDNILAFGWNGMPAGYPNRWGSTKRWCRPQQKLRMAIRCTCNSCSRPMTK